MRHALVFSGSSHPSLVDTICDRLGQSPGRAELKKFSNGETSVQIHTSIRDKDVFIIQSGSSKINDNVMELLIMISACRGGSSKSITAVLPYFPYCRMSKKKSHRGSITARMIANLLSVAGVNHVITIDLHASQMQGFFKCPVDNLVAEPLLARWIRANVSNWQNAVVVSKNPGGTKRVTSLADALKISFGIVTTDRRRTQRSGYQSVAESAMLEGVNAEDEAEIAEPAELMLDSPPRDEHTDKGPPEEPQEKDSSSRRRRMRAISNPAQRRLANGNNGAPTSPLIQSSRPGPTSDVSRPPSPQRLIRANTVPEGDLSHAQAQPEEFNDERARDVITGRLIHGHIVDDGLPSPAMSATSTAAASVRKGLGGPGSDDDPYTPDPMASSFMSQASSAVRAGADVNAIGGSFDATASSEDEEEELRDPELETTVTLVGNVRDRPVFIVDDMIDKAGSWVAAAETVVKRGGATSVYCMATHGLFGGGCLEQMEACECIDRIVVTNAFPIPPEKMQQTSKLVIIDVANLLAEAVRRNHHGESISQLYFHED